MFRFQGLARNLEQPEVKDWLVETKDQLMGDKSGKEKDEEGKKITWKDGFRTIYAIIKYD